MNITLFLLLCFLSLVLLSLSYPRCGGMTELICMCVWWVPGAGEQVEVILTPPGLPVEIRI